jgi:integrase
MPRNAVEGYRRMPLNATSLKNAKPEANPYKLFDTQGLFILINPNGSMLWRFQYSFQKKRKLLALGAYPDVSLADARQRRDEARRHLSGGRDPSEVRKEEKAALAKAKSSTFRVVVADWIAVQNWAARTKETAEADIRRHLFADLGDRPIAEIDAPELMRCLRKVEAAGSLSMVKTLRSHCSRIFRFGVWSGLCKDDPAATLMGAFQVHTVTHMATVKSDRIAELLAAMEAHSCEATTKAALRLHPMVFLRSIELVGGRWDEIDWENALWEIPLERMKKRRPHIVPLSKQAMAVLKDIQNLTGDKEFIFYSWRRRCGYIDNATPLRAMHVMGFKHEMTQHGFRALARTTLSELRSLKQHTFSDAAISLQLSHKKKDPLDRAYDRAELLDERRELMQYWSDHLDTYRK